MPDIQLRFGKDIIVFDGAMGTMLHREGISGDECALLLNVLDDEMIVLIHERYKLAGAQVITANSFGGTRSKLAEYGLEDRLVELNRAAVRLAKRVKPEHVCADVGPCGLLLEPVGKASFEQVFAEYAEQVAALALEEPDAILIETMTDIADARCAVLAAKSVCDLPVFVSCSFDPSGHMPLSGTDPATAAVILEAAGADVIGMNCSLGPSQLLPLFREMAQATSLPLIIQPNAGLPVLNATGQTVYSGTADDFADAAWAYRELGAQFIGSCCGTNPAYTGAIYATVGGMDVKRRRIPLFKDRVVLASPTRTVTLGKGLPLVMIGERINPTGKKALTLELEKGTMSQVRQLARSQQSDGALLLDVNVGAAQIDAKLMLPAVVQALGALVSSPLVLDTTDYEALEKALRIYPGKALINSVNGDSDNWGRVFALAKRYGAALIALTMDSSGIPHTVEGRLQIAERIRLAAHEAGLSDKDLVFDALTLTAATDENAPIITLETVRELNRQGLATVLGISNVSHGLPDRSDLNAAFIFAAAAAGLSAAIANPSDPIVSQSINVANSRKNEATFEDVLADCKTTIKRILDRAQGPAPSQNVITGQQALITDATSPETLLKQAVLRGDRDAIPQHIDGVLAMGVLVDSIVATILTPTLQELGEAFSCGEAFLPQMMLSAGAMKAAVDHMKTYLADTEKDRSAGKVVFCTVQGDVHSIGKDICISLLESQGFEVYDLGVDVSADEIISAARKKQADVICLSALMTTTLPAMKSTVERIYEELPEFATDHRKAVAVGGAVVNNSWAESINARYSADAPGCVRLVQSIIAGN